MKASFRYIGRVCLKKAEDLGRVARFGVHRSSRRNIERTE